jgi:hypothetical protein
MRCTGKALADEVRRFTGIEIFRDPATSVNSETGGKAMFASTWWRSYGS